VHLVGFLLIVIADAQKNEPEIYNANFADLVITYYFSNLYEASVRTGMAWHVL
jgi:hypothetical protein